MIGIPDERWGEAVCAFVVLSADCTETGLDGTLPDVNRQLQETETDPLREGTAPAGNWRGRQSRII